MTCTAIEAAYGDLYRIGWSQDYGNFTFPGGESTIDAGRRFYAELLEVAKANIGKTILVAAHGAVIRSFWAIVSNISPSEISEKLPFATNASVSTVEYDGESFVPKEYSHDSHLSDIGITNVRF
jgi:broad specificity phosphatase PhoE